MVERIQEQLRSSAVILSDETGSRVDGSNWWHWVFCGLTAILHVIRFNRSQDVIQEVMGQSQAEVWVSDCHTAQLKAPAREHQICLSHQLRNLQAVVDPYPTSFWAQTMQALFCYAIHLHHQSDQLPADQFWAQIACLERLCDRLIQDLYPSLKPADCNVAIENCANICSFSSIVPMSRRPTTSASAVCDHR